MMTRFVQDKYCFSGVACLMRSTRPTKGTVFRRLCVQIMSSINFGIHWFVNTSKDSPQTAVETLHLNRLLHSPTSGRNQQEQDVC